MAKGAGETFVEIWLKALTRTYYRDMLDLCERQSLRYALKGTTSVVPVSGRGDVSIEKVRELYMWLTAVYILRYRRRQ